MPVIDVKQNLEDLTELVEIDDRRRVHPAPRRVRARLHARARRRCPTTSSPASRASRRLGRLGLLIHSHRRVHRRRVRRPHHARALERGQPADHALPRHEDRPDQLPAHDHARRRALRRGGVRSKYQGQRGPTPSRYWENFDRSSRRAEVRWRRRQLVAAVTPPAPRGDGPSRRRLLDEVVEVEGRTTKVSAPDWNENERFFGLGAHSTTRAS